MCVEVSFSFIMTFHLLGCHPDSRKKTHLFILCKMIQGRANRVHCFGKFYFETLAKVTKIVLASLL